MISVIAFGIAAMNVQQKELKEQRLEDKKLWTYWLSRHLAQFDSNDSKILSKEIVAATREEDISFVAIVSSKGVITHHSKPGKIGKPMAKLEWTDTSNGRVRVGHDPLHPTENILCGRIISPTGKSTTRYLYVGLNPFVYTWRQSGLYFWVGYILLAVLGLYLLMYRLFRRSVRPLAIIRDRLMGCREPVPERLAALRLNDSYDQISASWNELIEFVSDMQEKLRRNQLVTDVSAAMEGYRSERLTNILIQIPFGVMVVDADETISFANRAAVGLLGSSGKPLENTAIADIFDESLRMSLLAPQRNERAGQSPSSRWIDYTFKKPHNEITLRFWSIPSDLNTDEHILFIQDVTQAKEAERARDQFLYHITHELRTPLTNIRAYAETLSQGVIDDEQTIRECYNVIMGETQRLNRLVEDILSVSQLEVGTARLNMSEVQMDQLLRKVVQDSQGNADAKNIELYLNLPAKLPKVRGDRERLVVVMTNLVGNAIKYTPENGQVDIRCIEENGRLRIAVTDTGIGIPPEDQDKIFEKFYRVDNDQTAAIPGTGLGLSIVKETVRLHGGAVFVESTVGKGTTFTVVLPALSIDESGYGKSTSTGSLSRENK